MSASAQSAGRRLSLITIDQVVSGASNVLIAVLAARLLDVTSFGLFGVVFLVCTMALGVSRAVISDPLLVHPTEAEERRGEVIGTGLVLGLGLALLLLASGCVVRLASAELGTSLIVLAAAFPLLMLQDLGRYLAFAIQRPAAAITLDVGWLGLLVVAVAALFVTDTRSLPWFIAAWSASGALAGLLVLGQHPLGGLRPDLAWLRFTWKFSWRYLISYVTTQGAALAVLGGVGALAGSRDLGGLQGTLLLVRPFTTVQVAAMAATVGEVTRAPQPDAVRRRVGRTSAAITGVAAVNALVFLLLPDSLGRVVLGASWAAAQPLLAPTAVQIICMGLIAGMRAGMLGLRGIRTVVVIDLVGTMMVVFATFVGADLDGARGALWLTAGVQVVLVVVWWATFRSVTDAATAGRVGRHRRMDIKPPAPGGVGGALVIEPTQIQGSL